MRTRTHGTLFTSHTATRLPYSPLSASQGAGTSPHLHAHTLHTQTSLMRTSHINHSICSTYVHKPHTYHACTHMNTTRLSRTAPGPCAAPALMGHPKWPLKEAALPIGFCPRKPSSNRAWRSNAVTLDNVLVGWGANFGGWG